MAEMRPSGLIEWLDKLNEEEKPCVKRGTKYLSATQTADLACGFTAGRGIDNVKFCSLRVIKETKTKERKELCLKLM